MNLLERLAAIEEQRDLEGAISVLDEESNKNVDLYLRVIFLLFDFLVDGNWTSAEHDHYASKIKTIYHEAQSKYSENCDFLFYSAMMIFIAEYYFDESTEDDAKAMLFKAVQKSPDNPVYRLGAIEFLDNRPNVHTKTKFELSKQILQDKPLLASIQGKGLMGFYLLGRIENTYKETGSSMTT